jgi:hypothetical protein
MKADLFKNHVLFEKLDQFTQRLSEEESKQKIDIDNYTFYDSSLKYIVDRLKLTIPTLVQDVEMNSLANELDAGLQQINAFLGNGNVGHLTNVFNNLTSAINRARNFPLMLSKSDFNFSRVIADFQDTLKTKFDSVQAENDTLKNKISSFETELQLKESKLQELFKLIDTKELEIKNLNSGFQTEFNSIRTTSNQQIESDRKIFRSEFDQEKANYKKEIDVLKSHIDTDTTDLIRDLNSKLEEAKNIVNVIGNVGVTGNYQLIANEHKSTANFWRWVAIGFMTVFSGLLIWTIYELSKGTFDWTKSLIRLVAAAALSYPATYAARESSRHRRLETLSRTAELELASLNPFIELLPEAKKQAIKEKLVEKYFGNNTSEKLPVLKDEQEEVTIGAFEKILKAILPIIKK